MNMNHIQMNSVFEYIKNQQRKGSERNGIHSRTKRAIPSPKEARRI